LALALFFAELGTKPRALHMLGKHSPSELIPSFPTAYFLFVWKKFRHIPVGYSSPLSSLAYKPHSHRVSVGILLFCCGLRHTSVHKSLICILFEVLDLSESFLRLLVLPGIFLQQSWRTKIPLV
jgi:hypothetical protein